MSRTDDPGGAGAVDRGGGLVGRGPGRLADDPVQPATADHRPGPAGDPFAPGRITFALSHAHPGHARHGHTFTATLAYSLSVTVADPHTDDIDNIPDPDACTRTYDPDTDPGPQPGADTTTHSSANATAHANTASTDSTTNSAANPQPLTNPDPHAFPVTHRGPYSKPVAYPDTRTVTSPDTDARRHADVQPGRASLRPEADEDAALRSD